MGDRLVKWFPAILAIISLVSYVQILQGFFIQDEWYGLGYHLRLSTYDPITVLQELFAPTAGHYQPFTLLVLHILVQLFQNQYLGYAVVSIILHTSVVLTVYILLKNIFSKRIWAFTGATIFATMPSIHQGTSWVMADIGVHMSVLFALFSVIFFVKFFRENSHRDLVVSILLLIVALLFKESVVGLFALYTILIFKKFKISRNFFTILTAGVIYSTVRLAMLLAPKAYQYTATNTNYFDSSSIFVNMLMLPYKAFTQTVIPEIITLKISQFFVGKYTHILPFQLNSIDIIYTEPFVIEVLSLIVFLIIGGIVLYAMKKAKLKEKFIITFGFLWVVCNILIFAVSPERSGLVHLIDSRNLYFVAIGFVILLTQLLYLIPKSYKKYIPLLVVVFVLMNSVILQKTLHKLVAIGNERKSIVSQIIEENPILPEKVIFFTESTHSYYGLPEDIHIMPFQSGFGQTLLVNYFKSQHLPSEFVGDRYLWEITEEDYKEIGGRGFGYVRTTARLEELLEEHHLSEDNVIRYIYDGATRQLTKL